MKRMGRDVGESERFSGNETNGEGEVAVDGDGVESHHSLLTRNDVYLTCSA